jgi:hypothetical protein
MASLLGVAPAFNLKTAIPATEITEDTEMKRVLHIFPVHLMGEANTCGNPWFFSVLSVFSVAN